MTVAQRTMLGVLANTTEGFLTANPPQNLVLWPALRNHLRTTLLGADFERVLQTDVAAYRQTAHEDVATYGERFLAAAKDAYPEPWVEVVAEQLVMTFAKGLKEEALTEKTRH